jgi:uncharacterized protein YecT (DUF1311 family)
MKTGTDVAALALLLLCMSAHTAKAENCNNPGRSTAEHARCELGNEAGARSRMDAALGRALTAAAAERYRNQNFVAEIQKAQALWIEWSNAECELEANATMGSAGAFLFFVCHRQLDEARTQSLNDLATQLGS